MRPFAWQARSYRDRMPLIGRVSSNDSRFCGECSGDNTDDMAKKKTNMLGIRSSVARPKLKPY